MHPFLAARFPVETAAMAAGVFGYGSEVLRLDDEYSTDHHFGLRVNVMLPEGVVQARGAVIEDALAAWPDRAQAERALASLAEDGLITVSGDRYTL